jgi:hypothetical protein
MPYRLNPLHPDLHVCETCQAVVCPVPLVPPIRGSAPASLTVRQTCLYLYRKAQLTPDALNCGIVNAFSTNFCTRCFNSLKSLRTLSATIWILPCSMKNC